MIRVLAFIGRHPWRALALAAAGAVALAAAVIGSGVVPITASSGHWAITEWFLHTTMRRSVATHALAVEAPPADLDGDASVMRGAGHYETGCRSCHGAPGERVPAVPRAMTPHPPLLAERVGTWTAPQLFYIVKHGVKFTGMPAFPAQARDDEVWAVVGFLRRLPDLSPADYDALVWGDRPALAAVTHDPPSAATPDDARSAPLPDLVAGVCARCHGRDGTGRGTGAFPRLAGQRLEYLTRAMDAYARGARRSGIMQPVAERYAGPALAEALRYYAARPRAPRARESASAVSTAGSSASVSNGALVARQGDAALEIPACAACHDADPANEAFPRLRGQHAGYLALQLTLMRDRRRGGSAYLPLMHAFVDRLTDQQIDDVSAYFAQSSAAGREASPRP